MSEGRKAFVAGKHEEAKKHLAAAAELVKDSLPTDGRYALSPGELARVHLTLLDVKAAGDFYTKAFEHVGRDTPRDGLAWAMIILDRIDYLLTVGDRSPKHGLWENAYALIAATEGARSPEMAAYWARLAAINVAARAQVMALEQIGTAREQIKTAGPEHVEIQAMTVTRFGRSCSMKWNRWGPDCASMA